VGERLGLHPIQRRRLPALWLALVHRSRLRLVLGVPIIDTFWIIVRRISERRSPFTPDRTHIHHRLLDLGLSHRQTVLVIYGICICLAILALILTGATQLYAFLGVFVASGLVLFLPTRGGFRRPDELEAESYEPATAEPVTAGRVGGPAVRASPPLGRRPLAAPPVRIVDVPGANVEHGDDREPIAIAELDIAVQRRGVRERHELVARGVEHYTMQCRGSAR
jgi:hypothetical protein